MTIEVKSLIKSKNIAWIANKNLNWSCPNAKARYRSLKRKVYKAIKQAVKNYEAELVRKVKSNPKLFYNYINNKASTKCSIWLKYYIWAIQDSSGKILVDQKLIAEELNNYFKSVFTKNSIGNIPVLPNTASFIINSTYFELKLCKYDANYMHK